MCFQGTFNRAEMPGEGVTNWELQLDIPEGTGGSFLMVCVNNNH